MGVLARRQSYRFIGLVAVLVGTVSGLSGSPGQARADAPPPPNFSFTMSDSNVVPGPGDPGGMDEDGSLYGSNTPGELCFSVTIPFDSPQSIGLYQADAGSTGPLVLDLSDYLFGTSCFDGVPQPTIDALVANAADYYVQVDTFDFPDGASRGQLVYDPPTIFVSVASVFCPSDVKFPPKPKTVAKECGGMALPGQSFVGPVGYTSTNVAGGYAYDERVHGPAGFNEGLADSSIDGGGTCNPATHICSFGAAPYAFFPQPGPITVDPTLIPKGMKLAYDQAEIQNETGVAVTYGANGHIAFNMTGRYNGFATITYYFTGSPKLAPPSELAPTVDLAKMPVAADGGVALSLQFGATDMGNAVATYQLQVQVDGHADQPVVTTTKPVATVHEQAGHTYAFRVRATDQFGNVTPWAIGPTDRLDVVQDSSPAITYTGSGGGWTTASSTGAYGGTTTSTSDPSALASVVVTATELGLVMPLEPGGGHASYEGPNGRQEFSLLGSSFSARQTILIDNFGSDSPQQLFLQPDGDGRIDLDAIVLLRDLHVPQAVSGQTGSGRGTPSRVPWPHN
jgi:hypothetical protein